MLQEGYGRYSLDADGNRVLRYTAIDPANEAFKCTCGKRECVRSQLLPFREHIAELYQVLSRMAPEALSRHGIDAWYSVLYPLQMAASIDDVFADTGFIEDPISFAVCEVLIDYENAHSEVASKYVAATTIFNFVWMAYEAAVAQTSTGELTRLLHESRLGERGRRLFEAHPTVGADFQGLGEMIGLTEHYCRRGGLFNERLDKIRRKYTGRTMIVAAELGREFRNFIFHGEDQVPAHENWSGSSGESTCRIRRFYAVSRLLLYLIQALAWIEVGDDAEQIESDCDYDNPIAPRSILERVQLRAVAR